MHILRRFLNQSLRKVESAFPLIKKADKREFIRLYIRGKGSMPSTFYGLYSFSS